MNILIAPPSGRIGLDGLGWNILSIKQMKRADGCPRMKCFQSHSENTVLQLKIACGDMYFAAFGASCLSSSCSTHCLLLRAVLFNSGDLNYRFSYFHVFDVVVALHETLLLCYPVGMGLKYAGCRFWWNT